MTQPPTHIYISKPQWFKRRYEFWQNEKPVGSLEYKKWGSEAVLRLGDHEWKFNTTGFWKRFVQVRAEQSPYIKMSMPANGSYKLAVSLDNRHTWHYKGVGFWRRAWGWFDEKDNKVIEIKSNLFSKKNRGEIIFHLPVNTDMLLLMGLGWYMVVAYEEHVAASSSA